MDELISIDDRVWALIDRYDLHGTPDNPVDLVNLSRLENEFPLVVEDLSAMEVAGYVIPPHGDISPNNTSPIFVQLLVPVDTMARYETIDAIAAVCMVPRKLVELA